MDLKVKSNADAASKAFAEAAKRAENPAPAMKVSAAELSTMIDDSFRESGSPAGERWPSLAPSTLIKRALSRGGKRKRRRRNKSTGYSVGVDLGLNAKAARNISNVKPLVDTGVGRNSISVRAPGNVITIRAGQEYMAYHLGGDRTRNPPRPPRRAWAPVLWDGARWNFDARGKGGKWLRALYRRISKYVATGEV
jgi:phage gpG-like protein